MFEQVIRVLVGAVGAILLTGGLALLAIERVRRLLGADSLLERWRGSLIERWFGR
jgi:hypothetical protein